MQLDQASTEQLRQWETELSNQYQQLQAQQLNLDLTRGKPSSEQLDLSDALDGILQGNYLAADGTDTRNYGGLDGIAEAKELGARLLGVAPEQVLAGGNSSLTLMFQSVFIAYHYGLSGPESAWKHKQQPTFICPCPGYDRHFTVCEQIGIKLVTVPMLATGPDMDAVEALIQSDDSIVGMWCVPKYSNPTGVIYSDDTVDRIAKLANIACPEFRVFWDNAYAVHDLVDNPAELKSIAEATATQNTEDSVLQFASTSKITQAGSGVAFLSASSANLKAILKALSAETIGPDKINQLRHARFLPDQDALRQHMRKHAAIIKPRFDIVLKHLQEAFGDSEIGKWESPEGGYFISFDTPDGCAREVVRLAAEAGVKLTPAGATFPYGKDPKDNNIRIAPTVPSVSALNQAMEVFVTCVKLASVRARL